MWRSDPATSMVIGWDQISGTNPVLYFDTEDFGKNADAYRQSLKPAVSKVSKGMNNQFVRLANLRPNTVYFFIVKDSDGVSKRYSFKTAPNNPDERISIIAGGDSRNHRAARVEANRLVSKLRPTCIMFAGDMTAGDSAPEWINWFDDWQQTFGSDGRIFPIIAARGNHEASNQSIVDMFDVPNPDVFYAMTIGGNLLRVYTLNSLIASGGNQKGWLGNDLTKHPKVIWKIAQYHHTIRPHTQSKPERDGLLMNWATLFYKFGVNVAVESDAHTVKWTWPLKPSNEPGSTQGFIRDDEKGTVFIGEGCWGAPLRANNDDKPWTRNSGSFNQFKWLFVDKYSIEIRTVQTESASNVAEVDHNNIFKAPHGLKLWNPSNGSVIKIFNKKLGPPPRTEPQKPAITYSPKELEILKFQANRQGWDLIFQWATNNDARNSVFELQKSIDRGNQFATIAKLVSKGNGTHQYQCQDKGFTGPIRLKDIIYRLKYTSPSGEVSFFRPKIAATPAPSGSDWSMFPKLALDESSGVVRVKYTLEQTSDVVILLIDPKRSEVSRIPFREQKPGPYLKSLDMTRISPGRYLIIVRVNNRVLQRYRVIKHPS